VAARRKSGARGRGASRGRQGAPAWLWLLGGVLIGLGLAWYLFGKGYIPQPPAETVEEPASAAAEAPAAAEELLPRDKDSKRQQYDFFTVLPEMEVVVPEQELTGKAQAQPATAPPKAEGERYLLQVGSFRDVNDADQLKARLALLGVVARVQSVTVNDATWHRVRVGPVGSAREADDMRNRLADNGIDSLVMKDQ
jgi:cell division protein FtsN